MHRYRDLKGQRFGRLIVQEFVGINKGGFATWLCQCDCGRSSEVIGANLMRKVKAVRSCGCLRRGRSGKKNIDITGQKFGRLTAKSYLKGKWLCECECGGTKEASAGNLRKGNVQSCGCIQRPFSDLEKQDIVTAHNSGISTIELMERYGCSRTKVNKAIRDYKKKASS